MQTLLNTMHTWKRRHWLIAWTLLLSWASSGFACSIPVFRYALEHWAPDAYRIFVFYDGPLDPEQQKVVEELQKKATTANVIIAVVPVQESMDERAQVVWKSLSSPELPAAVIQLPGPHPDRPIVWSGRLADLQPAALYTSPVRSKIVRELEGGASAVWVMLESGNAERDEKLFDLLNSEIERLHQTLKLPPIEAADLAELSGSPSELKIRFSSVRVSRNDADEALLVDMLLSTEPDLKDPELNDEPMVFPVFGRGRALYALVGDGISSQMIEEGGRFLTGACQCTVKLQNPGTDLLLTAGWETYVAPTEPQTPEYVAIPNRIQPTADEKQNMEAALVSQIVSTTPPADNAADRSVTTADEPAQVSPLAAGNRVEVQSLEADTGPVEVPSFTPVAMTPLLMPMLFKTWGAIMLCLGGAGVIALSLLRRG